MPRKAYKASNAAEEIYCLIFDFVPDDTYIRIAMSNTANGCYYATEGAKIGLTKFYATPIFLFESSSICPITVVLLSESTYLKNFVAEYPTIEEVNYEDLGITLMFAPVLLPITVG